jgi:hypothetical protein
MASIPDLFKRLLQDLIIWAMLPSRPGLMYVHLEDLGMANRFRVFVQLPPLAAGEPGEVLKRTLSRSVNGGETVVQDVAVDMAETSFEALQNDSVHLELRNIDDGNNVSEPSIFDFVVLDTIAPAAPSEMGVRLEEIPDPAPTPETPS